jgi:hypothetical protein
MGLSGVFRIINQRRLLLGGDRGIRRSYRGLGGCEREWGLLDRDGRLDYVIQRYVVSSSQSRFASNVAMLRPLNALVSIVEIKLSMPEVYHTPGVSSWLGYN